MVEPATPLSDEEILAQIFWEGLAGYGDGELKDVCPSSETSFSAEIRRAIFQH
jgi:hypothetical protein